MNVADSELKGLLEKYKKFVVYGLSPDPEKTSNHVPTYMSEHGYDIVGTYPKVYESDKFKIYPSLKDVPPEYRKFVDVFRSSDRVGEVVDEILAVGGVEVMWLQLGITNPEAEARAEKAGIKVVSDHCVAKEHRRWGLK